MDIEQIIGVEALYDSLNKCKKGVRWKSTTGHYLHHWPTEINHLSRQLRSGTYKQRPAKFFTITEPKVREIMSIHFRDRVYQRSLNDVALYPQTSKSFIKDNFACQKGKGTDAARDRFRDFLKSYYRHYGADGYVLSIDIKGYYPNMDRAFAIEMLKEYVDPDAYRLAEEILDEFPGEKGFNPGSQLVQIIGITALDRLDHFIKERLRIKYFIRYMDDFKIIHHCRAFLEIVLLVIKEKLAKVRMMVNETKTKITKLCDGTRFLGFIFHLEEGGKVYILVDPAKIKHEKRKIRRMIALMKKGEIAKWQIDKHFKGFKAGVRYGNSHELIKKLNKWYLEEISA